MNWLAIFKWGSVIISVLLGLLTAGNAASVGLNTAMGGDTSGLTTVAATGAGTVTFGILSWLPYILSLFGIGGGGGGGVITPAEIQALLAAVTALLKNIRDPVAWRNLALAAFDMLGGMVKLFPSDNPKVKAFTDWLSQGPALLHDLFNDPVAQALALPPPVPLPPQRITVSGRAPTISEVMAQ